MEVSRALADTSVFVATESSGPLRSEALPAGFVVSVVTLGELRAGVLAAADPRIRATRLATYERVVRFETISIDAAIAETWADLRAALRQAGRAMGVNDSWIAATAITLGIPVATQDLGYPAGIAGLEVIAI